MAAGAIATCPQAAILVRERLPSRFVNLNANYHDHVVQDEKHHLQVGSSLALASVPAIGICKERTEVRTCGVVRSTTAAYGLLCRGAKVVRQRLPD